MKNPPAPSSEEETVDELNDHDVSLMDRTRRLRQARENTKKKAQFDQLVEEAREKVEATKAAKLRSAESQRILADLQSQMAGDQDDPDSDPTDEGQFVSKSLVCSDCSRHGPRWPSSDHGY